MTARTGTAVRETPSSPVAGPATGPEVITITVTRAHVLRFFTRKCEGSLEAGSGPLALALREATGLPFIVQSSGFYLWDECLTCEGLGEPVRQFVRDTRHIMNCLGFLPQASVETLTCGLSNLLALVPFSFEFCADGLPVPLPQKEAAGMGMDSDSDSESESIFRQDMDAESDSAESQRPSLFSDTKHPLSSLLDLQKEIQNLSGRFVEERDYFAAAAQTFALSPTKGNRKRLRGAIRSVRGIHLAYKSVFGDIQEAHLLNMTEAEAQDFCTRATRLYPEIAARIAANVLGAAEAEGESAHV